MADEVLGLDIGTTSLKLVGLRPAGQGHEVIGMAIAANPIGRIIADNNDQRVKLVTVIKDLVRGVPAAEKRLRVGLAESQVYTRVIQMPILSDSELASAIRWEAEQHVPVPIADVQLDYSVLSRPEKGIREGTMDVLLVAARRLTVGQVADLIELTSLELVGIETGLLAAIRALSSSADPPTLLIHIGASSSDFAVMSGGKLILTYSVPTAGSALTRSIELELGLPVAQAEQYKRSYGLSEKLLEGRVRSALLPVFTSIMQEAKKAINSYESTVRGNKIQRVILSGGGALLPGISADIAAELSVSEVIMGNPFYGMAMKNQLKLPAEYPVYSAAVGLAKGAK